MFLNDWPPRLWVGVHLTGVLRVLARFISIYGSLSLSLSPPAEVLNYFLLGMRVVWVRTWLWLIECVFLFYSFRANWRRR